MAVAAQQKPPDPSRDEPSDLELVAAANRGDVDGFEALYRRYRDWVVGLAYRYTRDRELALDVLQETFLYVLGKFPGFELRSEMKTFLYPTVRHLSVALQSKATRKPPTTGSLKFEPPPDPGVDERLRGLAELIEDLPVGQREVLMLRFADGLSLAEIAEALQIPLGTVKSRLHGAIEALRADERAKKYFDP
ncbi:MAG: RNA polymerase sigma factor [Planctomycetota bacterium]|jgi:RNA polymerase sigma-70 factor (ECF subfamily)